MVGKMKKKKVVYTREFKEQAVSLVRDANRPASEVAIELGINANTLYTWLNKCNSDSLKESGNNSFSAEIKRLKKALAQAELERDILKKAAAYFAKETL